MNENHVIDSWIAELGLSGRRVRRSKEPALPEAGVGLEPALSGRETRHAPPARGDYGRRPRYQAISSPC